MKILIRKLQAEWPAWVAIASWPCCRCGACPNCRCWSLTFSMPFLWRSAVYGARTREVSAWVLPLFLCFWIPMLLSSFDSFDPHKSWGQTPGGDPFSDGRHQPRGVAAHPLTALEVPDVGRADAGVLGRGRLHPADLRLDLFGIPVHADRLNALFFTRHQFYGPILAMLSPLLLEYARRRWNGWAWAASFALIMGAVMIAGMRSGWLAMGMVIAVYAIMMLQRDNRELRKASLTIPALAIIVIALSYAASPLFQQRVATTLAISGGTEAALDEASSLRVPIFRTSWSMYLNHPVNGVGVRAFPVAYLEYAGPDDPHVAAAGGRRGATHAHNIVLEVMADTGTIGLLGLLAGGVLGWRRWRQHAAGPAPGSVAVRTGPGAGVVSPEHALRDLRHLHLLADLVPGRLMAVGRRTGGRRGPRNPGLRTQPNGIHLVVKAQQTVKLCRRPALCTVAK